MIAAQHLQSQQFRPGQLLGPYISAYCLYDFPAAMQGQSIFFLPEGIIEIVVQLGAQSQSCAPGQTVWRSRPAQFVGGLHTRAYLMRIQESGKAWSIRFKPGAFRHFTVVPVHHLKNLLVAVEDIWGAAGREWLQQCKAARTSDLQALTEAFLLKQCALKPAPFPASVLLQFIKKRRGQCRVAELSKIACLSDAQFRLRFNEFFGISPKVFLRLYRLHYARQQFADEQSFTSLAYQAGYFDQAHFNREVKAISGLSPKQLFPLLGQKV